MERMLIEHNHNPFLVHSRREFDAFYAMTMAKPPFLPGFIKAALAQGYIDRRAELAEIFRGFYRQNMLDEHLTEITAPTLVIWGTEDQLVEPSSARVWAEGLPRAQLVIYDGIGHMPMVEIPKRSAADYAAFLSGLSTNSLQP
jgi:pimeloyl-ACP methyl ester carboxylesterase